MSLGPDRPVRSLRALTYSVYLPTVLFAIGQGAVVPVIALTALELNSSIALATVATAIRGIGTMVFDVPAGGLVERFGERRSMLLGTGILVVALFGCIASPNVYVFLVSVFLLGVGWAVWLLARLTYVADQMPPHMRGRALSTLGGVGRIGNFVGPFVGAAMIAWIGLDGAYLTHMLLAALGVVALWLATDRTESSSHASAHPPVRAIVRQHRKIFATVGMGVAAINMLRASRHAILPLWGVHVGLDATAISIVFGISAAMDVALFYPAGAVSDRVGRKVVAVSCLGTMAIGFVLLPLSSSFVGLSAVGALIGVGNGIGSGIVMTLGTDLAPLTSRASFLGVWRLISDLGQAGGPMIAAGVSALATLGAASVAVGGVGLVGVMLLLATMPETLRRTDG